MQLDIPFWYLASVLLIAFAVTFTLRALPFAILEPLRKSQFVRVMAVWMPAGILVILALATFKSTLAEEPGASSTCSSRQLSRSPCTFSVGAAPS